VWATLSVLEKHRQQDPRVLIVVHDEHLNALSSESFVSVIGIGQTHEEIEPGKLQNPSSRRFSSSEDRKVPYGGRINRQSLS
jgi:hypothetical protein